MTTTKPRPKSWPPRQLGYGGGTWRWNGARGQYEIAHPCEGKKMTARGATPAEAITARDRQRAAAKVRKVDNVPNSQRTVAELLAAWRPAADYGKAGSTVKSYDWSVAHLAPIARLRCEQLNDGVIEDFLLGLAGARLGPESISKVRGHLSMACRWGIKRGYFVVNPVRSADSPDSLVRGRAQQPIDVDEFHRIREALLAEHSTAATAFALMLLCGLRPGEALGLRWKAIDWKRGTLDVRSSLRFFAGGERVVDETKTDRYGDHGRRTIQMPPALVTILRREQQAQAERCLSSYVLADAKGGHLGSGWMKGAADTIAALAGVTGPTNPNSYRHRFASMLLQQGVPPMSVVKVMGHKNMQMLMTTYAHSMVDVPDTAAALGA